MESQHDVFHRADERRRQLRMEIDGMEPLSCCPHPKEGRVYVDAHEETFGMCGLCAFMDEADASLRRTCDVCGSRFDATFDEAVWEEFDINGDCPAMPGFTGTLVVVLITPCRFPECQAMASAYTPPMAS